jgi:dimethylamine/trimethylamine dehydrogenase
LGAARPSIADPFLPRKIEEGRVEDIRECIGCNICVSGDESHVPIRCTQNPTMGEEWRRGWHPERIQPKTSDERVLIIGAGPAGLEAARALGQRGYDVTIAEKSTELGGRVAKERRLPGFGEWGRVVDYREYQIKQMTNVDLYLNSEMTPDTLTEFEADHVVIATGSKWASDGIGRENPLGNKNRQGY